MLGYSGTGREGRSTGVAERESKEWRGELR
jgi:hypothetical protein